MPFVQAQCENCGGILAVDSDQKEAVCPFCNAKYVVQDAINNYNVINNINVGAGATVNVYGSQNEDFEIVGGRLIQYKGESVDIVIPDNVVEIGEAAFQELPIRSVVIPNSVTSIDDYAFVACKSLANITLPDSVTHIGDYAFNNCSSLKNIIISDNIESIGREAFSFTAYFNDSKGWENGVLYLGKYLLIGDTTKANGICTIKNGTKLIADWAFLGCRALTDVAIPDSVTSIGEYAFYQCTALEKVTFGKGITRIEKETFFDCASLLYLVIPDSVTSIGEFAFAGCESLRSVIIPDRVTSIGKCAFSDIPAYANINIPAGVQEDISTYINPDWLFERRKKEGLINQEKSGCYVATAVYGSYDCPQVWTLRRYRDYKLDSTWYGRLFILLYYAISPTLVKLFGNTKWFRKMWKGKLDRMVERLQAEGYESTPYNDKY